MLGIHVVSPVLLVKIGAEGQNRTADTTIFSRVLYRLSYLGTPGTTDGTPTADGIGYDTAGRWEHATSEGCA